MESAREHLSQAEAFLIHKEFANAQIEASEAMAAAARVPLYTVLVDPFTSEQALWEFENIFARSGRSGPEWIHFAQKVEDEQKAEASEARAQALIALARKHLAECERLHSEITQAGPPKPA
jgi:hypothetical protein